MGESTCCAKVGRIHGIPKMMHQCMSAAEQFDTCHGHLLPWTVGSKQTLHPSHTGCAESYLRWERGGLGSLQKGLTDELVDHCAETMAA